MPIETFWSRFARSITSSIFISVSIFSPYPLLHSTNVVPDRNILNASETRVQFESDFVCGHLDFWSRIKNPTPRVLRYPAPTPPKKHPTPCDSATLVPRLRKVFDCVDSTVDHSIVPQVIFISGRKEHAENWLRIWATGFNAYGKY